MKKYLKWGLLGCGGLVVVIFLLVVVVGVLASSTDTTTTPTNTTTTPEKKDTPPPTKEDKEVTLKEFNEIKTGMTYDEVVKIIGFKGEEGSMTELGGIKTIMYTWNNPDFSNMNATFQNDKLVSKAQFGLK